MACVGRDLFKVIDIGWYVILVIDVTFARNNKGDGISCLWFLLSVLFNYFSLALSMKTDPTLLLNVALFVFCIK